MRLVSDWALHFIPVPLISRETNLDPQQDCPYIHGKNSHDPLRGGGGEHCFRLVVRAPKDTLSVTAKES